MSNQRTVAYRRINITLPENTLGVLDRVAEKGDRSAFVDKAVNFYVKEVGRSNLEKQLRLGSVARAKRDISLAVEWFSVEEQS